MLPSGPTVRPSTLLGWPDFKFGSTVSVCTLPRFHAAAGGAASSMSASAEPASAAAMYDLVMSSSLNFFDWLIRNLLLTASAAPRQTCEANLAQVDDP